MSQLTRNDLFSLEQYAEARPAFRARVMAHKNIRRVSIGEHASLYFEDALTMQYQVQEMLRIERIFESAGIQDELDVYNPLIPDGSNWKATFMLEYSDVEERRAALARLIGVERRTYVQVGDHERVYPIVNEDLDRETEDKTSSVHFMRFELTPEMIASAKAGSPIKAGIDHAAYKDEVVVTEETRQSLVDDLEWAS